MEPSDDRLVQSIQSKIIEVTHNNGGHLASNLGVIELTVALHKVFDFKKDRLVFDVSHQCYAHKILSQRKDQFSTLRQTNGLSGFSNPCESDQDVFITGHAGTALSSAIGLATGYQFLQQNRHVIAFLGDASLTNGLTLEALNNINPKLPLIIILNDNGYAISKNIGAISKYLNTLSLNTAYNRTKKFLKNLFKKLPGGNRLISALVKTKKIVKSALLPSSWFESYGLRYIGPIDGHNMDELIDNLKFCKNQKNPILLHVKTIKGHGNLPAMKDPGQYHACAQPKKIPSVSSQSNYSEVFGKHLVLLAEKNPKIVAITAAMLKGTGLSYFQEKFPEKTFDVGIAEGHAITFAAGLSKSGILPVCSIYSTFLQRAFDEIFHDIALQNLPIVIAIDRAGICASDGPTHHGLFDIAYLNCIPNLILMQPKNPQELIKMMDFAVLLNRPCCIRYPRETLPSNLSCSPILLGQAEALQRGKDICIFTLGEKVHVAFQVSQLLPQFSISIVNLRFIKPIDQKLILEMARNHRILVSIEDHVISGGIGSIIAEILTQNNILTPLKIWGWPDEFIPHASCVADLEQQFNFTAENIAQSIKNQLEVAA